MPRPSLKLILPVLIAAIALVAAGCGGDDALTKDEFIAQGDEICATGDEELTAAAQEQFGTEGEPPPRDEQEAFISDVVAPNFEAQLADLEDLNPPEEDQEQVDELLAALGDLTAAAKDDPAAVLDGEVTEASELAQAYGFTACGS